MSDNLHEEAKEILGGDFGGMDHYFELFGGRLTLDGEFTLDELKAIVQAWENRVKGERGNDNSLHT